MIFEGICLITNNVKRLYEFYQKVLETTSDFILFMVYSHTTRQLMAS